MVNPCFKQGANGYISKASSSQEILLAIQQVLSGENYLHHTLADSIKAFQNKTERLLKDGGVSERQIEVLHLLGKGLANKAIADQLFISEATVKSHINNLFKALNVKNRVECIRASQSLGLI